MVSLNSLLNLLCVLQLDFCRQNACIVLWTLILTLAVRKWLTLVTG